MIVYGTQSDRFKEWRNKQTTGKENGAYYYAREIEENILPVIDLHEFILTAGATLYIAKDIPDGAVVVCHDNRSTRQSYGHLFNKGITWICSKQSTVEALVSYGEHGVYVPLSIDTEYVKQFKRKKTEDIAYVGNSWAFKREYLNALPANVEQLSGMDRVKLLQEMAKYKRVIAEGRCLMEAQVLGSKTEVPKYDNAESVFVKALDNRQTIPEWTTALEGVAESNSGSSIIRGIREFNDLTANRLRRHGEVFRVSTDRAEELLSNNERIVEEL